MHRPIQRRAPIQQIIHHRVPAALLARDHDVDDAGLDARAAAVGGVLEARAADGPVLPALRAPFHGAVALEHAEEAVGAVEARVLGEELGVHVVVGGRVEGVDVGLGDGGAGEADEGAGAEGEDGVVGG